MPGKLRLRMPGDRARSMATRLDMLAGRIDRLEALCADLTQQGGERAADGDRDAAEIKALRTTIVRLEHRLAMQGEDTAKLAARLAELVAAPAR